MDCLKLVGIGYPGVNNLGEILELLFQMFSTFTNMNRESENQLAELEKAQFPSTENTSTLSRFESEEMWKLYDTVNLKLGEIEVLKN